MATDLLPFPDGMIEHKFACWEVHPGLCSGCDGAIYQEVMDVTSCMHRYFTEDKEGMHFALTALVGRLGEANMSLEHGPTQKSMFCLQAWPIHQGRANTYILRDASFPRRTQHVACHPCSRQGHADFNLVVGKKTIACRCEKK